MTRAEIPMHAANHKPGGSDPLESGTNVATTDGTDTVDPTDTLSFDPVFFDVSESPTGTANVTANTGFGTPGPAGPVFGDGSDGDVTITQSTAAPAWASKSGAGATTTFSLIRDVYFDNATFDDSAGAFLVKTNGYRLFAIGELLIDASVTVHNSGVAGGSGASTGAGGAAGTVGGGGVGGVGGTGGSGSDPTDISASIATEQTSATVLGGAGGDQVGGPGTGGGAASGGRASRDATHGAPHNLLQATNLIVQSSFTKFTGGAGGGGGDATVGAIAGAGGGGGGIVAIYAHRLTNNGSIACEGGIGGNSAGGGTGGGGGGGGQGGAIVLVYVNSGSTPGSTSVAGAVGGTPSGTGKTGGTGQSGLLWEWPL